MTFRCSRSLLLHSLAARIARSPPAVDSSSQNNHSQCEKCWLKAQSKRGGAGVRQVGGRRATLSKRDPHLGCVSTTNKGPSGGPGHVPWAGRQAALLPPIQCPAQPLLLLEPVAAAAAAAAWLLLLLLPLLLPLPAVVLHTPAAEHQGKHQGRRRPGNHHPARPGLGEQPAPGAQRGGSSLSTPESGVCVGGGRLFSHTVVGVRGSRSWPALGQAGNAEAPGRRVGCNSHPAPPPLPRGLTPT